MCSEDPDTPGTTTRARAASRATGRCMRLATRTGNYQHLAYDVLLGAHDDDQWSRLPRQRRQRVVRRDQYSGRRRPQWLERLPVPDVVAHGSGGKRESHAEPDVCGCRGVHVHGSSTRSELQGVRDATGNSGTWSQSSRPGLRVRPNHRRRPPGRRSRTSKHLRRT